MTTRGKTDMPDSAETPASVSPERVNEEALMRLLKATFEKGRFSGVAQTLAAMCERCPTEEVISEAQRIAAEYLFTGTITKLQREPRPAAPPTSEDTDDEVTN
jgi:hypothetical protein